MPEDAAHGPGIPRVRLLRYVDGAVLETLGGAILVPRIAWLAFVDMTVSTARATDAALGAATVEAGVHAVVALLAHGGVDLAVAAVRGQGAVRGSQESQTPRRSLAVQ
jgi:hypothetical protein